MTISRATSEVTPGTIPGRRRLTFRFLLAIFFIPILIPVLLRAINFLSPVVDVRNRVDSLGGRITTSVAVPEFMVSIVGQEWNGWTSSTEA